MSPASVRHPGEFRWETNLLATVTLALTCFGIANCYATGTYLARWYAEASQQLSAAIVGGACFLVAAYTDYQVWRRIARPLFYATLAGLGLIAIVALIWRSDDAPAIVETFFPWRLGARRWLKVGVQVQVSELARFTLAAFLAARAAELGAKVRSFRQGFVPLMGTVAGVALLVLAEPSLSMAIVLAAVGTSIAFAAGARIAHFAPFVLAAAGGLWAILTFEPVRAKRFMTFLSPALECDAKVEQACQSLIGFGNGGWFGVGFGEGTQKLGHLPFGYSDFILSVIGEEWGFVGVAFVLICFGLFCWMGFRVARTARDPFGMFLATGLTTAVGITSVLHTAVVTRAMPTTGLTLPFMSAGRISLVLYLFSAGVLVSIGRRRGRPARET